MARMNFRDDLPHLRRGEKIGPGLHRVVRKCCAHAAQRGVPAPTADAVHEARRALKRARAALRLGWEMGAGGAKAARQRLSALARELSSRRDAAVAAVLVRRLESKLTDAKTKNAVIASGRATAAEEMTWWQTWQKEAADAGRQLETVKFGDPTAEAVRRALHRSARRVGRSARTAILGRNIARLHEWRKAVIVLREQVHIVRPLLTVKEAAAGGKLHRLALRLGKATDYNVLSQALKNGSLAPANRNGRARLGGEIDARQAQALRKVRECWPKVRRALRKRFSGT